MSLLSLSGSIFAHDPTIVKENGIYYCFSTHGVILKSNNLKEWSLQGKLFEHNFDWVKEIVPACNDDIWAPEIIYRNGTWRIYYSCSSFGSNISAIGLAENKTLDVSSPDYKWVDKGCIIKSVLSDTHNCIDAAVVKNQDGKDILLFGSFWGGLKYVYLNDDGLIESDSEPITIATRNMDPNPIEGGFIFPHGNYYYLFASHDFCCRGTASSYHIVVGRADKAEGPYFDMFGKEMMQGGGTTLRDGFSFEKWAGPGHNSVFQDDDGKTYMVYHAYDRENDGRPNLMIEEIQWDEDWPSL